MLSIYPEVQKKNTKNMFGNTHTYTQGPYSVFSVVQLCKRRIVHFGENLGRLAASLFSFLELGIMRSLGSRLWSFQEVIEQGHPGSVPHFLTPETAQCISPHSHRHAYVRPTFHLWLGHSLLMNIILKVSLRNGYFSA